MTWGEIQKISLEKMFIKQDELIDIDKIDNLKKDEDCKWYLSAMPTVCNEAIQRIKPYVQNFYQYNETSEKFEKTIIDKIDNDTDSSYVLSYPEDACVLIPLYIASQLYKDDDIALATAYRNEFETGLQGLNCNIENSERIVEVY